MVDWDRRRGWGAAPVSDKFPLCSWGRAAEVDSGDGGDSRGNEARSVLSNELALTALGLGWYLIPITSQCVGMEASVRICF